MRVSDTTAALAHNISLLSSMNCLKMRTANLFLPFKKALDIQRQGALSHQKRLQRLNMSEELSFVVAGASAIQVVTTYLRFERRSAPLGKRVCGLHVVMAVD